MMILKVISFALVALFLYLLFKDKRGDLAALILLAAGVVIFIYCISQVSEVVNFLKNIADRAGIDTVYIQIVLKILAIAYLASFASEICKDSGAGSLASKVEFSGKMFILVLAIPILMAVLDSILQIL
ncbi:MULTISPECIES: stage III sporulation protein AD [Clostridium]|jgi:stage III sporulation protein AD|uniref:stage III sporulation protein AD n=1 Tax=Clostridium TaxID=1485 RepID=UPI00047BDD10|nr:MULTISPECIES: stage III sporulation protein AD [Clostridium]MDU1822492.1 stage III sporulation protein AD [Clostridium sp.]MDU1841658.1 stage III sporulation protein AD [Clostridium sp.]MDU2689530.1 stage III sporulation protein AD [Clostridium sp.]MDU2955713.1 stage III sporulation protein AD [Clostridium sp.]MDU3106511.1 stage III sporulation protein AD [Clostridium sp.]